MKRCLTKKKNKKQSEGWLKHEMYNNYYRKKTIFPHRYSKLFYNYWWSWIALWTSLLARLKIEKDCFVLITGDTGSGKSHWTGNMCLKHAKKEPNFITGEGNMFIPDENFIIDPEEFAYKMITKEGQVLWLDEARDGVNSRNWFSSINKGIASRKNKNRKLFNIYFMCMPLEREFDKALIPHLTMWIWIRRGVGEIYCKRSGVKGGTGLDIQKMLEREEKYLKENPTKTIVNPAIHPEYVGRIAFSKLTAKLEREYKALVNKKKATGELSDEEKEKFGIEVKRTPKQVIKDIIEKIKDRKIQDKKSLWEALEEIKTTDDKKLKQLNFYLKLEGWGTFDKLFKEEKKVDEGVEW